jgi:hypothetical protein
MKISLLRIVLFGLVLALAALACGGSFSTANISNAWMTASDSGGTATTVFAPDQTFYCKVELKNAPDDTQIKAVWTAVQADGTEPNLYLDETTLTSGDATLTFNLSNSQLWPNGKYKVDLYLNDTLNHTLEFEVR